MTQKQLIFYIFIIFITISVLLLMKLNDLAHIYFRFKSNTLIFLIGVSIFHHGGFDVPAWGF